MNYVNLQHNYVTIRLNYVKMQNTSTLSRMTPPFFFGYKETKQKQKKGKAKREKHLYNYIVIQLFDI